MSDPSHDVAAVKAEFKKRWTRQLIATVFLLPAFVAVMWSADQGQSQQFVGIPATLILPVGGAVILIGVAFSLVNWRCPACRKYLRKQTHPRFCSSCGVQFRD